MKSAELETPVVTVRRSEERGATKIGWLDGRHTFSFGEYYDPRHMAFRSLRVINEDIVAPGMGFGTHPHRDMEILTWMVSGELQHRDSMGNGRVIKAGELQFMSAGTGVTHSEFNPNRAESAHLLQIWITPSSRGLTPTYAEWREQPSGALTYLATPDGSHGSTRINQDASLLLGRLAPNESVTYSTAPGRGLWVQVVKGEVQLTGATLKQGDGAAIEHLTELSVTANAQSEFLLFDLA